MSKEDTYKIAMIACASVAGALLIILIFTWICCCCCYQRRRRTVTETYVAKPRIRTQKEVVRWDANPYEGYGQNVEHVQVSKSGGCGCGGSKSVEYGSRAAGGCKQCEREAAAYGASAYEWMAPRTSGAILNSTSNPYNPTPIQTTTGVYNRVQLNNAAAIKPSYNSTQLTGGYNTGVTGNSGNMSSLQSTGYLPSSQNMSSGAQFVLESANKY